MYKEMRLGADRMFFSLAALWFVALTLVGFGRTFYFRALPEPLPTHQVVHGIVYSAWVLLFLAQAILISAQRRRWHIALGSAAVVLLMFMIPVGFHVVLVKVSSGMETIDEAGFNLTGLMLGFALAFAGLATRKRPFIHKRLMMVATVVLTTAAADRAAIVFGLDEVRLFRKLLAAAPAFALVGYDAVSLRRIPVLSSALVTVVWLNGWFVPSDVVFMRPAGEAIIRVLTQVFVW